MRLSKTCLVGFLAFLFLTIPCLFACCSGVWAEEIRNDSFTLPVPEGFVSETHDQDGTLVVMLHNQATNCTLSVTVSSFLVDAELMARQIAANLTKNRIQVTRQPQAQGKTWSMTFAEKKTGKQGVQYITSNGQRGTSLMIVAPTSELLAEQVHFLQKNLVPADPTIFPASY